MAKNKLNFNLSDTRNLAMLSILIGLLFVIFPVGLISGIAFIIGLVGIAFGAFHIYGYFTSKGDNENYPSRLALGLIFTSVGLYFAINPNFIARISSFIFGLAILVSSAFLVQYAMDLKKADYKLWNYTLIIACVCMILGVLVLADIFGKDPGRTTFIGASLIVAGLAQIASDIMLSRTGFDKSKIKAPAKQLDSSIISDTFDDVKNTISEAVDKVSEKKNEVVEDAKENVKEAVEKVEEKAETIKEEVKKEAKVAKENTEKAVKDTKEAVVKEAEELKEDTQKAAKNAKEAVEKKAEEVKEETQKATKTAKETVEKKAEEAKEETKKAASNTKKAAEKKTEEVKEEVKKATSKSSEK